MLTLHCTPINTHDNITNLIHLKIVSPYLERQIDPRPGL